MVCSVASAVGQTLNPTPAIGTAGETVAIDLALRYSSSDKQPTSIQWEARIPSNELQLQGGLSNAAVQPIKETGKSVACAMVGKTAEDQILRCVMAGGDKPIQSGAIARFTFSIPEGAHSGEARIRFEHVLAVTRELKPLPLQDAVAVVTIRNRSNALDTSHNGTTPSPTPATVSNAVSSPQRPGLIGHWTFDEGAGNIARDTSGRGYDGTIKSASWTKGKINSALTFNGADSVVTPNIALGKTFSISAWVNPATVPEGGYVRIAETRYDTGLYLGTDASGSRYQFIVNAGFGSTGSCGVTYGCAVGGTVAVGWHLVTGTYDGTTAKLYVDAVLVARDSFKVPANSNVPLFLGQYYAGGYGWNGVLDDVRLYNRALTASEVNSIYLYTLGVPGH